MKLFVLGLIGLLVFTACSQKSEESVALDPLHGMWEGIIEFPESLVPIQLEFKGEEGFFSVPIQNVFDLPFESIVLKENATFTFQIPFNQKKVTFDGVIQEDRIVGLFKEDGAEREFYLTKVTPDEGEQVTVEVTDGTLNALLSAPAQVEQKIPVAIFVPDAGPVDKNGNSSLIAGKAESMRYLSNLMNLEGIATLRYDKRGIGDNRKLESTGKQMTVDQYAADVEQLIKQMRADDRFSDIILVGHGEGSLIASMVLKENKVEHFISLAGYGFPFGEKLMDQIKSQLTPEQVIQAETIITQWIADEEAGDIPEALAQLFNEESKPFLQSLFKQQPVELLKGYEGSITVIAGERDLQISPKESARLKTVGEQVVFYEIPLMNHVLKQAPEDAADEDGNLITYTQPDVLLSEAFEEVMVEVLQQY